MRHQKRGLEIWFYRLFRNPVCLFPLILCIFVVFLYVMLQSSLHENYFAQSSLQFESHENFRYNPIEFQGERIVHLDFKGAPLRIAYLKKIFPLIANFGATGILIEYEDTFPFVGEAIYIRAHTSYTMEDITSLNRLAYDVGLKVIPLVQTLGRLDYVLKLPGYSEMREVTELPRDICPSHPRSVDFLANLTYQIIAAHPYSSIIHIGGGEVINMGRCKKCQSTMNSAHQGTNYLYLKHIKAIVTKIKTMYPNLTILAWDNHFRNMDTNELVENNIRQYIQPVIWNYDLNVENTITTHMLDKYSRVFPKVWIAGAFKGATGSDKYLTQPTAYIRNHQSWMSIYAKYKSKINIAGMILTGSQRYDHFSILCELFPVSVPTLGLCLTILKGQDVALYSIPKNLNKLLHCQRGHSVTFFGNGVPICSYPGGAALDYIMQFHELRAEYNVLKKNEIIRGWLNAYNVKMGYASPHLIEEIMPKLTMMHQQFEMLLEDVRKELSQIYFDATVREWLQTYFEPQMSELATHINNAQQLMKIFIWKARD